MDPLSITAGCVALTATATKLADTITRFVRDVRAARGDLDAVSRELGSLQLILLTLEDEFQDDGSGKSVDIPDTLRKQIHDMVGNCQAVLKDIDNLLEEQKSSRIGEASKWTLTGRADVRKLQVSLEAHRSALDIALELVNVHTTKAIKKDTADIIETTRDIKSDTEQILMEIERLREQLPRNGHDNFMLERYLDQLTSYAETVVDANESLSDAAPRSPAAAHDTIHHMQAGKRLSIRNHMDNLPIDQPHAFGQYPFPLSPSSMDLVKNEKVHRVAVTVDHPVTTGWSKQSEDEQASLNLERDHLGRGAPQEPNHSPPLSRTLREEAGQEGAYSRSTIKHIGEEPTGKQASPAEENGGPIEPADEFEKPISSTKRNVGRQPIQRDMSPVEQNHKSSDTQVTLHAQSAAEQLPPAHGKRSTHSPDGKARRTTENDISSTHRKELNVDRLINQIHHIEHTGYIESYDHLTYYDISKTHSFTTAREIIKQGSYLRCLVSKVSIKLAVVLTSYPQQASKVRNSLNPRPLSVPFYAEDPYKMVNVMCNELRLNKDEMLLIIHDYQSPFSHTESLKYIGFKRDLHPDGKSTFLESRLSTQVYRIQFLRICEHEFDAREGLLTETALARCLKARMTIHTHSLSALLSHKTEIRDTYYDLLYHGEYLRGIYWLKPRLLGMHKFVHADHPVTQEDRELFE